MKSKDLYLVINQIDDDLIESANNIKSTKVIFPIRRYALVVACFCIMITGVYMINRPNDTGVYINQVQNPMFKSVEDDLTPHYLSASEVKEYFDEFSVQNELLSSLRLDEQSNFVFLMDENNKIYDDTAVYLYINHDQILEITLSKVGLDYGDIFNDGQKKKATYIDGEKLLIGSYTEYRMDDNVNESINYVAEFKHQDIFIRITSGGIEQEDFIQILEEVIDYSIN